MKQAAQRHDAAVKHFGDNFFASEAAQEGGDGPAARFIVVNEDLWNRLQPDNDACAWRGKVSFFLLDRTIFV